MDNKKILSEFDAATDKDSPPQSQTQSAELLNMTNHTPACNNQSN